VNLETPDVRYARSGDVSIAYQVVGEGPSTCCSPLGSSIEFEDRGVRKLKGVPGEWQLFAARLSERAGIR
jgi:hypothetical protein